MQIIKKRAILETQTTMIIVQKQTFSSDSMTIRVIVRKYFFIFMNDCDEIIAPPNQLFACQILHLQI
jgi:hypothetical protein